MNIFDRKGCFRNCSIRISIVNSSSMIENGIPELIDYVYLISRIYKS